MLKFILPKHIIILSLCLFQANKIVTRAKIVVGEASSVGPSPNTVKKTAAGCSPVAMRYINCFTTWFNMIFPFKGIVELFSMATSQSLPKESIFLVVGDNLCVMLTQ